MRKKRTDSLSLIEILIVIAIIASLYFLITPPILTQLQKARDARRKLDINLIQKGLEEYYDSTGCYPQSIPECGKSLTIGKEKFINEIPCDPKNKSFYPYISSGETCSPYFKLYAKLERNDDPNIKLSGCQYGCGPNCAYNFGVSSPNISLDYCQPPTTPILPSPTPIQYVCAPGSGPKPEGQCEPYAIPTLSECPKVYPNDPTCQNECGIQENRCKNAKGKYKPSP